MAFVPELIYMLENCPECGVQNKVLDEVWFHGVVSYFLCAGCDRLFALLEDGEWDEHDSYQNWLKGRRVVWEGGGVKTIKKEM
jgi:transcription elongation factor Elf1|tara:strand:- start:427 stop:675 length:249 start_codon:yes stop_codon:yes gene_type:complete